MNKAQFVEAVAKQHNMSRKDALRAVDAVLDTMTRTVVNGGKVSITGFGIVEPVDRSERGARNPQTGDRLTVAATRSVRFRPGQALKDLVAGVKELPSEGSAVAKAPKGSLQGGAA